MQAVEFLTSDAQHVTVSYCELAAGASLCVLLVIFKNTDYVLPIYNGCQVLETSVTWE